MIWNYVIYDGRYGDLTKQYEVPLSRMLHDILEDDHIQWVTPSIDETLHQFFTFTDLDLITEFDFLQLCGVSIEYLQRVRPANRGRLIPGHLVLSHFGTCMCSNVETNLSWTCLVSGLLSFEHPSVLLFCLISVSCYYIFTICKHWTYGYQIWMSLSMT